MKALGWFTLIFAVSADASEITLGRCSPSIGSISGNAVVNICPGEHFSSAQEALLVASHPTTVSVTNPRFMSWFEDNGTPFLTVSLKNESDVPAISVIADVLNLNSGSTYPTLKPLRLGESHIFIRAGSRAMSIRAGGIGDYPLFSAHDLLKIGHTQVPRVYCPYDASTSLNNEVEIQRVDLERSNNRDQPPTVDSDGSTPLVIRRQLRPTMKVGLLIRLRYRTIFDQSVTSYTTVFIDYADTRVDGDVWYSQDKKYDALRCVNQSNGNF